MKYKKSKTTPFSTPLNESYFNESLSMNSLRGTSLKSFKRLFNDVMKENDIPVYKSEKHQSGRIKGISTTKVLQDGVSVISDISGVFPNKFLDIWVNTDGFISEDETKKLIDAIIASDSYKNWANTKGIVNQMIHINGKVFMEKLYKSGGISLKESGSNAPDFLVTIVGYTDEKLQNEEEIDTVEVSLKDIIQSYGKRFVDACLPKEVRDENDKLIGIWEFQNAIKNVAYKKWNEKNSQSSSPIVDGVDYEGFGSGEDVIVLNKELIPSRSDALGRFLGKKLRLGRYNESVGKAKNMVLTEKKWAITLSSGKALRNAIHNEDYQGIIDGIVACYDEMFDNGIIDDYDHDAWIEDVLDIDITSPDVEEDINYELNNLYDACDNLDCWIALGESFKEGHSLPYTKWVKRADDGSWVMWGGSNSDKLDKDFLDRINHPNYPNKAYNIENQYLDAVVLPAGEEPVDESLKEALSSRDETKVRILLNKRIPRSDVVEDIIDVINQFPLRTHKDKLRLAKRIRDIYPVDDWAMEQIVAYAGLNKDESLTEGANNRLIERINESVYTDNGFKNRKDYLASLADDYGVDLGTVLNLANILGPDEDFDALVSELEDLMYDNFNNSDDDYEEDDDKQFTLSSFYDKDLKGLEDTIDLNWGDNPDIEDWIWEKCSKGFYVRLRDFFNFEDTVYRPVEFNDESIDDLIVKRGKAFSKTSNESLTEDTIKQNGKWVNKGKEGTHGKFKTKKEADAQRKAMFANGYKEGLDIESTKSFLIDSLDEGDGRVSQARFEVFDGFLDDFIDELAAELSVEGIEITGFTAEELDQDVANLYFTSGNATTNNVLSVSVEMVHDGELDENFVNTCISNAASSTGVDWSEHVEYADVTDTL